MLERSTVCKVHKPRKEQNHSTKHVFIRTTDRCIFTLSNVTFWSFHFDWSTLNMTISHEITSILWHKFTQFYWTRNITFLNINKSHTINRTCTVNVAFVPNGYCIYLSICRHQPWIRGSLALGEVVVTVKPRLSNKSRLQLSVHFAVKQYIPVENHSHILNVFENLFWLSIFRKLKIVSAFSVATLILVKWS